MDKTVQIAKHTKVKSTNDRSTTYKRANDKIASGRKTIGKKVQ